MKIVPLDEENEKAFWDHINQDPLDYYFFILDLKERPEKTKIYLALEQDKIQGLMLLYDDRIVQLRGSREAVKKLLDKIDYEQVELQAPLECEDIVTKKYAPKLRYDLLLMTINKGEENLQINHETQRLGPKDAEAVAEIMRKADPAWWGDVNAEDRKESLETTYWLGIKQEGKIVAIGNTRFEPVGSNIGIIATDEKYRNRGYATTIVSKLVREIMKKSPPALIHVLKHNTPAVRAYSKVGYKPFKQYLLLRAAKKIA
jgi:predicted GNAT family acetyltransferase